MKTSTFLLGLVAGAATAAVTVLYSTPKSGYEIRTSVKSASADMKDKFKNVKVKVEELKQSISHLSKEAKETIPEAVVGIKDSIEHWHHVTEPNRERMEKEISEIQTALEELERTINAHQQ